MGSDCPVLVVCRQVCGQCPAGTISINVFFFLSRERRVQRSMFLSHEDYSRKRKNAMLTVCEKLKDTKVGHKKYRRSKTGACPLLIVPFNVSISICATLWDIHLHALLAKVYIHTHMGCSELLTTNTGSTDISA